MKKVIKAYDELLIVKQKVEKETQSGIVLPDQAVRMGSMEHFEGQILALGPKAKKFKVGDWVLFGRNNFASMKRDGVEFLLLFERDVSCTQRECEDNYNVTENEFVLSGVE